MTSDESAGKLAAVTQIEVIC